MGTSILSLAMLAAGFAAVILAYEYLGNPQAKTDKKKLRQLHRIFGYTFAAIFVLLALGMMGRLASPAEFNFRGTLHAGFALIALSILLLKILIARRYKKFANNLIFFGSFLFTLAFALVLLTAGPRIGRQLAGTSPERVTQQQMPILAPGQPMPAPDTQQTPSQIEAKFNRLCSACHPTERALSALENYQTVEQWTKVIDKMRALTDTISAEDGMQIAEYLAQLTQQNNL